MPTLSLSLQTGRGWSLSLVRSRRLETAAGMNFPSAARAWNPKAQTRKETLQLQVKSWRLEHGEPPKVWSP